MLTFAKQLINNEERVLFLLEKIILFEKIDVYAIIIKGEQTLL